MTRSIGHKRNQIQILTFLATKQTIYSIDNNLDNINILPLVKAADIIRLCHFALMENQIYRTSMILNKQPITHILSFSVNRQRLTMTDIIDKQRNKLLRELIRTIVIGAIRHNRRHAVRIMECTYKMIARSL